MSVFADDIFIKTKLSTADCKNSIICTLRQSENRLLLDLLRNDSKGTLNGRMVEPTIIPDWLVPGTVLYGIVQGLPMTLTYEGVVQSRIQGLEELLGSRIRFTFVITTEFS